MNSRAELSVSYRPIRPPGLGGTWTYFRRPSQKNRVAMNISTPGMPKATLVPMCSLT